MICVVIPDVIAFSEIFYINIHAVYELNDGARVREETGRKHVPQAGMSNLVTISENRTCILKITTKTQKYGRKVMLQYDTVDCLLPYI